MNFYRWEKEYESISHENVGLIKRESAALLKELRQSVRDSDQFKRKCSSIRARIGALDFRSPHAKGKEREGIFCLQEIIRGELNDVLNSSARIVSPHQASQETNSRERSYEGERRAILEEIFLVGKEAIRISEASHAHMSDAEFEIMRQELNSVIRVMIDLDKSIGHSCHEWVINLRDRCHRKYSSLVYQREAAFRQFEADYSYFSAPEIIGDEDSIYSEEEEEVKPRPARESERYEDDLDLRMREVEMKVHDLHELEPGEIGLEQLRVEFNVLLEELMDIRDRGKGSRRSRLHELARKIYSEYDRLSVWDERDAGTVPPNGQQRTETEARPVMAENSSFREILEMDGDEYQQALECVRLLFVSPHVKGFPVHSEVERSPNALLESEQGELSLEEVKEERYIPNEILPCSEVESVNSSCDNLEIVSCIDEEPERSESEFLDFFECIRFLFAFPKPRTNIAPLMKDNVPNVPSASDNSLLPYPPDYSLIEPFMKRKFVHPSIAAEPFLMDVSSFSLSVWILDFSHKVENMKFKVTRIERLIIFPLCFIYDIAKPVLHRKSTDHWLGKVKKKSHSTYSFPSYDVTLISFDLSVFLLSNDRPERVKKKPCSAYSFCYKDLEIIPLDSPVLCTSSDR